MTIYLTVGYDGNTIRQQEFDSKQMEELAGEKPDKFVAGPYPSHRAAWKDCKLLNYLLQEDEKANFIFALLLINGVLDTATRIEIPWIKGQVNK